MKKFIELEKYSDIQADSMISEDNILIDDNQNIIFKNLLIFNQDYDIEASLLMKQASNYMHYIFVGKFIEEFNVSDEIPPCLLYTSPSPRDRQKSRMPSSA